MKILTLLRHAKSGWDDPVTRDFDRPLNPRGRRAARTVAQEMRRLGLGFDLVLASPARRVVETIAEVAAELGPLPADYDERLYLASPQTLLDVVHETPAGARRLLLIGHNPGLESLALLLSGPVPLRSEVELKYPTSTLAEIAFPVESWGEVRSGGGELRRFVRPRDLDPELGPED
ncbi:MAG: phosphohistidine phosphatase [Sphingomonadales bacterium]|jgi:phosphohistidine phosphatase|nr:phosphohistidine phosphatase [Sphingomonadales bacterium]